MTPVVDCTDRITVDAYEVPDRLRAQVAERHHSCRFPWCGREGRFDVDDIEPDEFEDPAHPGPDRAPGQTTSENLARLCRSHHRVKTHADWRYERLPDGGLLWRSPLGRGYHVDENGTLARA